MEFLSFIMQRVSQISALYDKFLEAKEKSRVKNCNFSKDFPISLYLGESKQRSETFENILFYSALKLVVKVSSDV